MVNLSRGEHGRPNDHYHFLLQEILSSGATEVNERTGVSIKALRGGCSFKISLADNCIPMFGNRHYYPHIAAAEAAWQTLGTQNADFITRHAPKLWKKFMDGKGRVLTAYGYRWAQHFGRDQISLAIDALSEDSTNRQVFVSAWDPALDGLGESNQPPNIPCPVGFSLSVVEKRLHMSVFIRSSDVFVGLPYDMMCYALTLDMIAASLGYRPGSLHITLAHAHIYEPHWEMAFESLKTDKWIGQKYLDAQLPRRSWYEVRDDPDMYVAEVREACSALPKPDFNPFPEVVL